MNPAGGSEGPKQVAPTQEVLDVPVLAESRRDIDTMLPPRIDGTQNAARTAAVDKNTPQSDPSHYPFESAESDGGTSGVIAGCKSWAVSTCVHIILIVLLAIFSTNVGETTRLNLVLGSDESELLDDHAELMFDASEWEEELNQPSESEETQIPQMVQLDDLFDDQQEQLKNALAEMSFDRDRAYLAADRVNPNGQNSSFFGIQAVGDRIIYVVDRSGSMWGSRWTDARTELIQSIEQLHSGQEFYVFLFSKKCIPMPAYGGRGKMIPATRDNIEKAKEWLMKQQPDGHTYPLSSVQRALRLEPDTIFLLTDGNFQDGTGKFLIERALFRKSTSEGSHLVVNTIAFHCEVGLEMLKQIAIANSGTFRHVE